MRRIGPTITLLLLVTGVLFLTPLSTRAEEAVVHHELVVRLDPGSHTLEAEDTITLPSSMTQNGKTDFLFTIHRDLALATSSPQTEIKKTPGLGGTGYSGISETYTVFLPPGRNTLTLNYKGEIFHSLDDEAGVAPSGVQGTVGRIGPEGVFLAGISGWYPRFGNSLATFSVEVNLPPGWSSVSQGVRTLHEKGTAGTTSRWEEPNPQDEIYLIAAPFTEFQREKNTGTVEAFLRSPDAELAGRYLDATEEYLDLYSRMLGPYPYGKFALVENFWETGFGMPSFTLLGPRVIRLPFILRSSYPHEILHNWWGNGVFLSGLSGNWSEGLTSYLADHFFREESGEGASYRRTSLQKYTDYVSEGADFPLSEFRGRNNPATEAVGYGKTLMLFHMLRQDLGDTVFLKGLRMFYKDYLFKRASFEDIRLSFEKTSGRKLLSFFDQWIRRTGAPALRVESTEVERRGKRFHLNLKLQQTQPGPAFRINVPVVTTLRGKEEAVRTGLSMTRKSEEFKVEFDAPPIRIDIDPAYDLFRRLDPTELPPALTQMIGAEETLFVLPSQPDHADGQAYRKFAEAMGPRLGGRISFVSDSEIKSLPADRAVWVLGWDNRFSPEKKPQLENQGFEASKSGFKLRKDTYSRAEHAVVLAVHRSDSDFTLGWIAAGDEDSLPGLARKVPHYGPYGFLVFKGKEPENVAKLKWPVLNSALSVPLSEGDLPPMGKIPPSPALSESF